MEAQGTYKRDGTCYTAGMDAWNLIGLTDSSGSFPEPGGPCWKGGGIVALLLCGKEWLDGGRCGPRDRDGGYRGPSSRMVVVDLDCEDDWGEVEVMEADGLRIRLGNDEDGYWRVKAAYEFIDPAQNRHETAGTSGTNCRFPNSPPASSRASGRSSPAATSRARAEPPAFGEPRTVPTARTAADRRQMPAARCPHNPRTAPARGSSRSASPCLRVTEPMLRRRPAAQRRGRGVEKPRSF